jgi:hypothetical protein
MVTDGEKVGTPGEEVLAPEQAETVTRATSVRAPQHKMVSFVPSTVPGIVMRTFMEPPHARGR